VSAFRVVAEYPSDSRDVWRAITDPEIVPRWTSTGRGGRPVGFLPKVGTRFQYVAKPVPGWNGVVECEVLEAREPPLLRYSWRGGGGDADVTVVTIHVEPIAAGTRVTWEHTGFTGIGGFLMLLERVRTAMLREGLPPVLANLRVAQT
jgi:uncharacterized protein YndB with AHSA1/START domain